MGAEESFWAPVNEGGGGGLDVKEGPVDLRSKMRQNVAKNVGEST